MLGADRSGGSRAAPTAEPIRRSGLNSTTSALPPSENGSATRSRVDAFGNL